MTPIEKSPLSVESAYTTDPQEAAAELCRIADAIASGRLTIRRLDRIVQAIEAGSRDGFKVHERCIMLSLFLMPAS